MFDDEKTQFNPDDLWDDTNNDKTSDDGNLSGEKGGEATRVERDMDEQLSGKVNPEPGPDADLDRPSSDESTYYDVDDE